MTNTQTTHCDRCHAKLQLIDLGHNISVPHDGIALLPTWVQDPAAEPEIYLCNPCAETRHSWPWWEDIAISSFTCTNLILYDADQHNIPNYERYWN